MTRSRATAKAAGSTFERLIADYLKLALDDDRIDRKVRTGASDKGDIANVRTFLNGRVTLELKDYGGQLKPSEWVNEVERERVNDDGALGIVVAKRRGNASPSDQFVLMTMKTFVLLLQGGHPEGVKND